MNIHIYLSLQKFTCDFILAGIWGQLLMSNPNIKGPKGAGRRQEEGKSRYKMGNQIKNMGKLVLKWA